MEEQEEIDAEKNALIVCDQIPGRMSLVWNYVFPCVSKLDEKGKPILQLKAGAHVCKLCFDDPKKRLSDCIVLIYKKKSSNAQIHHENQRMARCKTSC